MAPANASPLTSPLSPFIRLLLERGKICTRRLINAVMPHEKYAEAVRMLHERKAVKILPAWGKT